MSISETLQSPPVVQLYHFWSSVCSVRCRMALDEKGVKWESKYIDLFKFDQLTPEYLAINPDGVVPTLVCDGQPIRESVIINEYIDDAFRGPSLIPADPLRAARMREFIRTCEVALTPIALLTYVKYILPKLRNGGAMKSCTSRRRSVRQDSYATYISRFSAHLLEDC